MSSYVYVKNPNGTTYVYTNESYWDSAAKKTRHNRKCVGKIDPDTGGIVPTRKKASSIGLAEPAAACRCTVVTIGPSLLLDKAARETGLTKALCSIFPNDWQQILSCAYYLASEGEALCHAEQWSVRNKHPYDGRIADQRISELLSRITPSLQQDFFGLWVNANHNSGYYALDITSVSSYSEYIDFVRDGYNRDKEDLPQINLLMLTSESTRLPVYFRILSGSIHDVSTLDEVLKNMELLGGRRIHLLMDKGFFSGKNVDALYDKKYHFSIGVPFTSSIATDAVEKNRDGMDSHHNYICVDQDELYAVTQYISRNSHRCYIHIYYDSLKAELENKKFTHKLLQCYDELKNRKERKEDKKFYAEYFIVKEQPKRGRKVSYNEDAIQKHRQNNIGWLVLMSNKTKGAEEALRAYRQKDVVEKCFDDLKNDLDMKRLRIHTNATMEGRIFIQFTALILTTYLKGIMEKKGWSRNHNLQETFSEMKSIQQVTVEGRKKKLRTTPTKLQREILEVFDVQL